MKHKSLLNLRLQLQIGDYLAYLVSFVTESKRVFVRDKDGNNLVDKPTLKSCQKELDFLNVNIDDCIVTTEVVSHKNWEYIAKKMVSKKVEDWKKKFSATCCIIAFGGETNFRDRLPLLYQRL